MNVDAMSIQLGGYGPSPSYLAIAGRIGGLFGFVPRLTLQSFFAMDGIVQIRGFAPRARTH